MPDEFDPAGWAAVSALFDELSQLPEADRVAWLDALRARDSDGHASLLRLIAADAAAMNRRSSDFSRIFRPRAIRVPAMSRQPARNNSLACA